MKTSGFLRITKQFDDVFETYFEISLNAFWKHADFHIKIIFSWKIEPGSSKIDQLIFENEDVSWIWNLKKSHKYLKVFSKYFLKIIFLKYFKINMMRSFGNRGFYCFTKNIHNFFWNLIFFGNLFIKTVQGG